MNVQQKYPNQQVKSLYVDTKSILQQVNYPNVRVKLPEPTGKIPERTCKKSEGTGNLRVRSGKLRVDSGKNHPLLSQKPFIF